MRVHFKYTAVDNWAPVEDYRASKKNMEGAKFSDNQEFRISSLHRSYFKQALRGYVEARIWEPMVVVGCQPVWSYAREREITNQKAPQP